ncbi:MAG: Mut7-C RNAse domain-containing protein [Candidatus Micrarchaeota archaeon]
MEKKLLFDEMLKRPCTWLRIFGLDCRYEKGRGDDELLEIDRDEGYTLITKDEALSRRCTKEGVRTVLIKNGSLEEQIAQVVSELDLELSFPDRTRCPACGSLLDVAGKEEMRGKIPEKTYENNNEYWICCMCGKAYWRGGHWMNITRIFGNVEALLKQTNKKP